MTKNKKALLDYNIDFDSRTIYIDEEIDEGMSCFFMKAMDLLTKNKEKKKITIKINSGGGVVYDGLAIIDCIEEAKKKGFIITTKAYGSAFSMAALILASGSIRQASSNAYIMIHQGLHYIEGKFEDAKIDMKHGEDLEKRCNEILAKYVDTDIKSIERIQKKGNYYMNAASAKKFGIVDEIF